MGTVCVTVFNHMVYNIMMSTTDDGRWVEYETPEELKCAESPEWHKGLCELALQIYVKQILGDGRIYGHFC